MLLGRRCRLHTFLDGVPFHHQLIEDAGEETFTFVLRKVTDSIRTLYLPNIVECGEAYVLRYDQRRIHRLEIQHGDPVIQPGVHVVYVSAFDLVRTDHLPVGRNTYALPIGDPYQQRIHQSGRTGCEDILHRQFGHCGQVHPLPHRTDGEQDLECQFSILKAVLYDLILVIGPLLVHMTGIDIQLLLPEYLEGDRVECLLLGPQLSPGSPPCIDHQPSFDPPETIGHDPGRPSIPSPCEGCADPVDLRTFHDLLDIVVVDVVSGYDIGILAEDDSCESLDDLRFGTNSTFTVTDISIPILDDRADSIEEIMFDTVLDVETQDLQPGIERFDGHSGIHIDHQVRDIILGLYDPSLDMYAGAEIVVIDESVLEGDVSPQKSES